MLRSILWVASCMSMSVVFEAASMPFLAVAPSHTVPMTSVRPLRSKHPPHPTRMNTSGLLVFLRSVCGCSGVALMSFLPLVEAFTGLLPELPRANHLAEKSRRAELLAELVEEVLRDRQA